MTASALSPAAIVRLLSLCLAICLGAEATVAAETQQREILLRLDPESRALRVEDRFTLRTASAVRFDLAPWMEVVEARVEGNAVAATRDGWRVSLPASGEGGVTVEIMLQGVVPSLSDDGRPAGGAVAGAEGSYLPAGSGWLADLSPTSGDNRIAYRLTAEVPLPQRIVATGRLAKEETDGGVYRAIFVTERASEAPSVFAGPYVVTERRQDDLRVRTYFHGELAPLAEDYLSISIDYLARYGTQIGPYPYADFHIISAPLPVGLGFPNLTYVGRRVLPLPFMRGRSLAHEVLHNWWGNGVGIDYATGNWAEGLTSYQADYALAEERGGEAAREMRLGWLQNFAALPADRDVPVERFVSKRHDASQVVGYDKVAFIFHMLRAELGEATFKAGLQGFWRDQRFSVAGWSDLRIAFEAASGRDLGWFFAQWLSRPGAPRIELAEAQRLNDSDDHGVSFRLLQTDPVYRLQLPVIVDTEDGADRRVIALDRADQSFELKTAARALAVRIDPDFDTFRRLLPGESPPIFRDVTLSGETHLILPSQDPALDPTARALAQRLLQRPPEILDDDHAGPTGGPVLVIGLAGDVEALRRARGPFTAEGDVGTAFRSGSSARAWTARGPAGAPWLFVAAENAEALAAVARPLPHYRSRSFVVFDGSRAIKRGLWPAHASPLIRRFAD